MKSNLERVRSVLGGDGELPDEEMRARFLELYAEDVKLRWQGADWPWGGDMRGRDRLIACMHATSQVLAGPPEFRQSRFWILDDEWLLWWWSSRTTTTHGERFDNSGLTLLRFRDDKICEHWEYTDTERTARMFRGWRTLVDPEVGSLLASWNDGQERDSTPGRR